jgi:4-amino-4-deoxy-L-arabinose transferase-like glycosyltransferase
MRHPHRSDRRLFIAFVLIILSRIILIVAFSQLALAVVFSLHPFTLRVFLAVLTGLLLLIVTCFVLKDISVLWQVSLQAFAGAALITGAGGTLTIAFKNWHLLLESIGLRALACLLVGVSAGWLMRYLQKIFGLSRNSHLTC